jgi:putative membrane protein
MQLFTPERIAYCGAPPAPGALAARWNLDPVLWAMLAGLTVLSLWAAHRFSVSPTRRRLAAAGWLIAALALVSPLCALSVSLFSARVGQHMILTLIAAPLIALGEPFAALASLIAPRRGWRPGGRPLLAAVIFAGLLWLWHSPAAYDLTFVSTPIYWTMHVTLIGAAIWLWSELFAADGRRAVPAVAAALIAIVAMSLVGALITFSPRPLYAPHAVTTVAWGLSQLEDQQLGGAIMWVPGGVVFLAAALAPIFRALGARFWRRTASGHHTPGLVGTPL